ncbi:penicillin-binding protein [Aphanothece hegewaldii CCALA 016]|uniref:Penicillin-binding protein n=1 Tax=Aphanothece hegewaldii CCALA 016 TaxID=2107694 RepID=A0A2T1LYG1_9CHRO|nr:PBP1A family penicillin-binding protein [Aphanothece hegewaldii]PSF37438.1 penicillin-binding protein [Aphanothece hegewaldii CCALA 016]
MTNQPPDPQKNQLTQMLTVAIEKARVNFNALSLKKGARVPELKIQDGDDQPVQNYPLVGDRYTVGRSSSSSDIVIRSPIVSQVHFSLQRDKKNPNCFYLQDENSTNGVYFKKRRIKKPFLLHHGDTITIAPPTLANAINISYYNPPPVWVKGLRYGLYGVGGIASLCAAIVGVEWFKYPVYPLPNGVSEPVVIYARDGQTPLNPIQTENHRELEKLSDFSPYLPKAVLASEDSRYYWHFGVDPYGISRAVVANVRGGGIKEGASTLTQQLARSLFSEVGRQNNASRKLREMVVALKLEAVYSKNEILRNYLNKVYLGVGNYGFEDAAEFYFDKSAKDLTLSEAATLVAMLPAPNLYNPVQNYDRSIQYRNRVINRMESLRMISEEEADRARRSRIEVSPKATKALSQIIAPYFHSYVFQELRELLGEDLAKEGNFIVETGLNLSIQTQAEKALKNNINTNGSRFGYSNGALVTINPKTGEILALVGGVDYKKSQFNRATQAKRQPGSTFKVFAYAAAIEDGRSPNKVYSCDAIFWKGQRYKPCERSSGSVDMYRGLAQSENAIALRVAKDVGLDRVISVARKAGITSPIKEVPGLVLGQNEATVLEITGGYSIFANQGIWTRPHAIRRILDGGDCTNNEDINTCRVIYEFSQDSQATDQAISPEVARTMNQMMQGVIQSGTGKAANIGVGAAGKTGTTDKSVDLWFIGYTTNDQLLTGVWLGNDDNSPTKGSSSQAAQLWGSYMKTIIKD